MLPRATIIAATAVACLLSGLVPATAAVVAEWTPTNWTGVAPGAPVPAGLPASAPAPLTPVPYLPITYEGQSTCDPTPKPGAIAISDLIRATYGADQFVGIPRDCDMGGRSEHKEGRAVDWMVDVRKPNERAKAEAFLNWLLGSDAAGRPAGHAMQLGVMYIGWHDRIWRAYRPEVGWTELKGCFATPQERYDNTCHRNHIHISLTWAGASGTTIPSTIPPSVEPSRPPAPAQPGPDDDFFMSIGSQTGFETGPDAPLGAGELRTVDLAPVATGASSALVLVTTRRSEARGTVEIGQVQARSAVSVKVPRRGARGSVIQVPVAQGSVQIAGPKEGSVVVRVDVLGYTMAGGEHSAVGAPPSRLIQARFRPGKVRDISVLGVGPVPKRAARSTAVILRVVTKGKGTDGRFVAYPSGGAELGTQAAEVGKRGKRTSIIAADIAPDGRIALAASVATRATVDIIGYVRG